MTEPSVRHTYKFAITPEWVLTHPQLGHLAVRLYGCLARHGSTETECYPSHARLAEMCGVSERSVQAPLRDLERVGAIRRFRRDSDDGRQSSNGYLLAGDGPLTAQVNAPPAQVNVPRPAQDSVGRPAQVNVPKENQCEREPVEREEPLPAPVSALRLFGESRVEPAVPAKVPVVAKLILDEWWGRQEPKPQQRYVGALQVVKKALADGWEERDLREALDSIPIISGGALDIWRKKRTTTRRPAYGTGSKSAAQIADESMGRLTRLMGLDR